MWSISAVGVYTTGSATFLLYAKARNTILPFFVTRTCTGSGGLDSAMLRFVSALDDRADRTSDVDKEPPIALSVVGSSVSSGSTLEHSLPIVWVLIAAQ